MEPQTPNGVNSPASTTPSPSRPLNKKNGSSHLRSFGPGAKNNLALENLSEIAKNAVREISGEPCSARSRASEPGSARSRASSEEYNEGKSRSRSRTAQKIRKRGSSGTSSRTHRNTSLREAASAAISQLKFSAEHSDSSEGLEKDSPTQKTIQMDVPEHMRTAVATLSDSRRPGARRDRRGSRRSQAGRRGSKQYKRPVKSMLFSYNGSESGAKKKKLKEYSRLSQFQILVGVAKNDKDREMEEKMKLKNAVTLDHSTLRLFERLGVRHNVDSDSSSDNYTSGGSVSSEEHRSRYVKRRSRRRREILQQRKQNDLSKSSTSITEMGDDFYIETARSHARLRSPSPTSRQPPPSSPTAHSTQKFCSGRSPSTNAAREAHVRRSKKLALKYTRDVQSMNIFMAMVYERKQEAEKAEEMVAILAKKDLEADIQSKHVKYLESVEEREIAMVRKLSQVRQRKSTLLNRSISPKMSLKLRGGGEEGGLLKKVTAEIGIANHFAQLGAKKRVADIASGRDQSLSPNESSRNPSLLGSPLGTIAHKFRAISASISASSSPSSPPLNAVLKNISEHVPTDVGNISSLVASSDSPEPIDGGSCPFTTIVGSTVKIRSNHLKNTSERRKSSILGKLRSSRRPTHMHSHQIQARSQERADQRSARKAGREHRMKSAAKFDDFFHFDSDEDIPTDTALEQEKKRIEQASRAIDEGFGDESNSTKSDSTWGDITSSDEDELMVDIDVAQQRLLEKAMRRKSIREERVIDKGKVTAQGIMRKKAKNAEYYASMRDVVLANAQLNDQFIEAFAKNLKKFEEKYENNRRKKMEDDGYDYSPKQPTSPKASTRKRSRVNSVIRKRSFMPATNGNDSDGDDDRDNEEDILMMKNKYSPVSSLDLSNNRFSKLGTAALFDALTPVIHSINYNENDLSHSIDSVCRYLGSYRRCRLKTLKLSNTKLGNPNVVKLCKALSHNPHITALDLSNNGVNSQGCSALASLFERVRGVINLSLAWNKIDGEGSSVLFAAFSDVDSLITLDVSWNSIGTFPVPHPSQINGINALANYLHTSTSLFHLNLSANKFSMEDVAKLSTSLHNNVDIKGLHFDRNPFGKVDSKGHLVVIDEEQIKTDNQQHIHEQTKHHDEAYIGSSCWCCGQWVQVEFEFIKTYADNSKPDDEVFLRLSLDKWRKDKMTYDRGGRWYLFRMVPRILITYCFCVRTSEWSSDCYSNEQQKCFDSSAPVSTVNVVQLQDIAVGGADVDYTKHYDRERCGGTSAANTIFPFFNNILPMHINSPNCNPRGEAWAEEAGPLEEEFWCLESSKTFSVRNKENDCHTFWDVDLLYEKAFAHDWEFLIQKLGNMKLGVGEIEQINFIFLRHFRRLSLLYKHFVVLNRNTTFTLSMIALGQLLDSCEIIDGVVLKKRDVDRAYIATTSSSGGIGGLRRFEFLEALVRVSRIKFLDTEEVETVDEGLEVLIEDYIVRMGHYVDPDDFRKTHLYCKETEDILKVHNHNLYVIFNYYSTQQNQFGRIMTLEDYHKMFDDIMGNGSEERLAELITHDQVATCFVESKFAGVDDSRMHHKVITFVDFLECMCRVSFAMEANKMKNKFSFVSVVMHIKRQHEMRTHLIDSAMLMLINALKRNVPYFAKTIKIVFVDKGFAEAKAATILAHYVRRFHERRSEKKTKFKREKHRESSYGL